MFTRDQLFNCCPGGVAPNWAQFKTLEVGGCITRTEANGDTWTEGGIPDARAEFWTVYARLHDGTAEALTDCPTRASADAVAEALSQLSRLPVTGEG